jgi:hypothetical protein
MARTYRHNDDDALDENGLLRDGKSMRVPMMLRDSQTFGRRPGFVFSRDEYARDEAEIAHHEYQQYLQNAWRDGNRSAVADAEAAVGDPNSNASDASPQERAYQIYDAELKNMWRRPSR